MKTPDYMNYSRYKKNRKKDNKKGTMLFIATFCVTVIIFVGMAKVLSPDVDINIGNDPDYEAKDTGLGVKKFIDNRLKMIQNDDNGDSKTSAGGGPAGSTYSSSDSSSSKRTSNYNDASFDKYSEAGMDSNSNSSAHKRHAYDNNDEDLDSDFGMSNTSVQPRRAPKRPTARVSTPIQSPKVSKVYVGYYSNAQQAKVAQGILQDSGLGISPSVRSTGGGYTLQVGSYSNRSRADSVAGELQRNNFPARVVQEQ